MFCFLLGQGLHFYRGFTITLRQATLEKSPLGQRSPRGTELYLTTHTTNKRQTSIPQAGFEPAIPASEMPQNHALDRPATGTDTQQLHRVLYSVQKGLALVSDLSHNILVATSHKLTLKSILILSSYLRPCINVCSLILWGLQLKFYKLFSNLPLAPNGPPLR